MNSELKKGALIAALYEDDSRKGCARTVPENSHRWTATVLVILTLFFLAVPVLAQDLPPMLEEMDSRFEHTIIYDVGGRITVDRQLGHDNVTGATKNTTIRGYGEMNKYETVRMAANIIHVDETSNWTVPAAAIEGLRVTTILDLASRPMVQVAEDYDDGTYSFKEGDVINVYHPLVVDRTISVERLTEQLWAASILTDPGQNGGYESEFLAAYGPGPYEDLYGVQLESGPPFFYDEDYLWFFDEDVPIAYRDDKRRGYERGDYYVGNFFNIDQYAYTTGGEMRRLISISNPFENSLLHEDMRVIGTATVREAFDTHGLIGGPKAVTLAWYELF